MNKLLFIIPSLGYAGTNSALSSIYNAIKNKYDIKVLPINASGQGIYAFREAVVTSDLLTAWDADFGSLNLKQKGLALILKPFKHLKFGKASIFEKALFKKIGKRLYRKYHPEVVIGFQDGLATKVAACFSCKKRIAWSHCDYNRAFPKPINEIDLYVKFDKIVAVSEFTRSTFVKRYPTLEDRTIAIHNLLDIERIEKMSKEHIYDEQFVKQGHTIISVGRIAKVKHFDCIPEIASQLARMELKFRWFIVGEGDEHETQLIKDNIIKFKVEDNVILLGLRTNPYPYFREADLLVSTSISEACPMIFKEAQILGLPIVSADFGSAKEFVFDGINGYVSPIGNISKSIFKMLSDVDAYRKIKNDILTSKFDNSEIIEQLEKIL